MVVVVYDISNDKRRVNLSNFLEGYGHRIQFSVFECFISLEEMRQLHQKVKKLVLPKEDNVRFYWISNDALSIVLTIGSQKPEPPPQYYVI
ncbi:MAG: CRISPR-associated endonuclease Cas2 [Planktothrix sp.]|uniref:CRISPR-associated endonuclease Cas2 n=1 Tax=Planktothrix sp. TaxID=3088171 RepID=UPI0038D4E7B3